MFLFYQASFHRSSVNLVEVLSLKTNVYTPLCPEPTIRLGEGNGEDPCWFPVRHPLNSLPHWSQDASAGTVLSYGMLHFQLSKINPVGKTKWLGFFKNLDVS